MATIELRHCESKSPVRLAKKAVTKRMSHHVANSPWMPIMVLPTKMKSSVCINRVTDDGVIALGSCVPYLCYLFINCSTGLAHIYSDS